MAAMRNVSKSSRGGRGSGVPTPAPTPLAAVPPHDGHSPSGSPGGDTTAATAAAASNGSDTPTSAHSRWSARSADNDAATIQKSHARHQGRKSAIGCTVSTVAAAAAAASRPHVLAHVGGPGVGAPPSMTAGATVGSLSTTPPPALPQPPRAGAPSPSAADVDHRGRHAGRPPPHPRASSAWTTWAPHWDTHTVATAGAVTAMSASGGAARTTAAATAERATRPARKAAAVAATSAKCSPPMRAHTSGCGGDTPATRRAPQACPGGGAPVPSGGGGGGGSASGAPPPPPSPAGRRHGASTVAIQAALRSPTRTTRDQRTAASSPPSVKTDATSVTWRAAGQEAPPAKNTSPATSSTRALATPTTMSRTTRPP
ncbi:hypothetical protein BU14_0337s0005 [Porphyra umbilicalis]|uniref:Uncharacterized protein n=1 Tax=Porphyra umbilicalis TaxID=2786 RepID=A0A1X6NYF3_PORUM|nr:hypothetical protein BU14_0337s0005 [Porphyra umbilicalis]|eukprot:OSX73570.1 hypothetical protein BU14_0337s0005 [Porphyra umbilicalis]